MRPIPLSAGNSLTGLGRLSSALCFLFLGACAFNFNGTQIPAPSEAHQSSGNGQMSAPDTPLPIATENSPATGQAESPLGLQPMGDDQSSASQLMSEGTLGYVLDHLFGGANPHISAPYLPQPGYSTTTAGGMPGGLWPGNWWIQGQGGGYNLTHLP